MARVSETRTGGRTNLLVTAHLTWGNSKTPVRIRNISSVGALAESDHLPAIGTHVALTRGNLSARGNVVWRVGPKAGIEFVDPVVPAEWLPQRLRARIGEPSAMPGGDLADAILNDARDRSMAENLVRVRAMVEEVRLELSRDAEVLGRMRHTIEKLDMIYSVLGWQAAEL